MHALHDFVEGQWRSERTRLQLAQMFGMFRGPAGAPILFQRGPPRLRSSLKPAPQIGVHGRAVISRNSASVETQIRHRMQVAPEHPPALLSRG